MLKSSLITAALALLPSIRGDDWTMVFNLATEGGTSFDGYNCVTNQNSGPPPTAGSAGYNYCMGLGSSGLTPTRSTEYKYGCFDTSLQQNLNMYIRGVAPNDHVNFFRAAGVIGDWSTVECSLLEDFSAYTAHGVNCRQLEDSVHTYIGPLNSPSGSWTGGDPITHPQLAPIGIGIGIYAGGSPAAMRHCGYGVAGWDAQFDPAWLYMRTATLPGLTPPEPTSVPVPAPSSAPVPAPSAALVEVVASSFDIEALGATGAICFTGDSLLTLQDGSNIKFHDLQVGQVIASADRNGTISASPVVFLPHKKNNVTRKFDEVTLANGMAVLMTRNHLLPLCDGSLVTARSLKEGDCLNTKDGMSEVATTKHNVEAGGIYTAVTENEFLVVDGIVASPFALAHGIAHSLFDRADVSEWCKDNAHLVSAAKDEEVKDLVSRRRLLTEGDATSGCEELMETLFENYKDEGVGWGTNGFGYKNFQTLRGAANEKKEKKKKSLLSRLSGF